MVKQAYIYFLTNRHNKVLYLGVTNDLIRRVAEHKAKINKGFAYKYSCDKLVYFESFASIEDAITREKQLKNWKRKWKDELINGMNPELKELSYKIGVDEAMIRAVKEHYKIADQVRNDNNDNKVPKTSLRT